MYSVIDFYTGGGCLRWFHWGLLGLILLFLILSPRWIRAGLSRDPGGQVFRREAPEWYGIVDIWHIASFKPYVGSLTSFLAERAAAFEKDHPGIHIRVTGLTEKQFQERIDRGDFPDAYSFAAGTLYEEQLAAFSPEVPDLVAPARPAEGSGGLYALPYCISGYALAVNTQQLYQAGLTLPEEGDTQGELAFLQEALSGTGKTSGLFAPAVLSAKMGLRGSLSTREDFLAGKALAALSDHYTVGSVGRNEKQNLLLEARPCFAYSDLVQYIGPGRNADEHHRQAIAAFAEYLLSEPVQQRLGTLGLMPVVEVQEAMAFSDPLPEAFYVGYRNLRTPDPFLYQKNRDALLSEAERLLCGDESGLAAFQERFAVVFGADS